MKAERAQLESKLPFWKELERFPQVEIFEALDDFLACNWGRGEGRANSGGGIEDILGRYWSGVKEWEEKEALYGILIRLAELKEGEDQAEESEMERGL